jgi:hypothetical protein
MARNNYKSNSRGGRVGYKKSGSKKRNIASLVLAGQDKLKDAELAVDQHVNFTNGADVLTSAHGLSAAGGGGIVEVTNATLGTAGYKCIQMEPIRFTCTNLGTEQKGWQGLKGFYKSLQLDLTISSLHDSGTALAGTNYDPFEIEMIIARVRGKNDVCFGNTGTCGAMYSTDSAHTGNTRIFKLASKSWRVAPGSNPIKISYYKQLNSFFTREDSSETLNSEDGNTQRLVAVFRVSKHSASANNVCKIQGILKARAYDV